MHTAGRPTCDCGQEMDGVLAGARMRLNPNRGPATTCEACGYCDHVSPYGGHLVAYSEHRSSKRFIGPHVGTISEQIRCEPHLRVTCVKCQCEWLIEPVNAAAVIGLRT